MRIGLSKAKQNSKLEIDTYHRVIIPVYIPNLEEDYFKGTLEVLKLCISSLLNTIHNKTRVSIINNECCTEVTDYLNQLYKAENEIDQLYNSQVNLGKVNAIYGILKSTLEPIITITDADVMFLPQWQSKTETIFKQFPKAGMVAPVPSSIAYENEMTSTTVGYGVLNGKIEFADVVNPQGLHRFQESIGREIYFKEHLDQYPILECHGARAVIGCGHFVATMKRSSFDLAPVRPSQHKIVGGSERTYIDKPNNDSGFLRLATLDNHAYHMGNVPEQWMHDEVPKNKEKIIALNLEELHLQEKGLPWWYQKAGWLILKIFRKKKSIRYTYFKKIGLRHKTY
ncbi:glycosyltransferase family A protein [Nonlabens sp.]|jgi:hypothetical protein|uniref:glycosyltransferase family A protein n=1 Tax=Nonlabens sp. TaxID=1888209 RepID=UPI003F6A2E67